MMRGAMDSLSNCKIRFTGANELSYEEEVLSLSALGKSQIVVKTIRSLFSPGTELALYTGTHVGLSDPNNRFAKYPFYPGYSSVGEVIAAGEKVTRVRTGDVVYTMGGHAKYHVMDIDDRSFIFPMPEGVCPETAVFARLAAISATAAIQSQVKIGTKVAVFGLGLIGNFAAQLMGLLGAEVAGIDTMEKRLDIAGKCGVKHRIDNSGGANLKEAAESVLGGLPDIVIEATGVPELINAAADLVRAHGQVVLLGSTRGMLTLDAYKSIHCKNISITGAHEAAQGQYGLPTRDQITKYVLRMIQQGSLRTDLLLTHVLKFSQAKEAYELLLNRKDEALGVQLSWC